MKWIVVQFLQMFGLYAAVDSLAQMDETADNWNVGKNLVHMRYPLFLQNHK